MNFLVGWSKNSIVYKKTSQKKRYQDEATEALKNENK
jgi:hypothetical protein